MQGNGVKLFKVLLEKLTTHEVINDGIESTIEVAEPVRDQGEVDAVLTSGTNAGIPS